jgi:hypothetical protein
VNGYDSGQVDHQGSSGNGTEVDVTSGKNPLDEEKNENFGNGITISEVHKYVGMYMEDGTNEIVSDMMMLIVQNQSEKDLQLANINLTYADFVAEFEVTNLPAGQSVVVLEKNRRAYTDLAYEEASIENVIFFRDPMSVREDLVEIRGGEGYLDVKNITDEPLGMMYIYYKNSATDIYYGGITYRAKITEAIRPGETLRVAAGHYAPSASTVLWVQVPESVEQ